VPEAPVFTGASIAQHAGPTLFIADAANAVERRLLEACLERHLAGAVPAGAVERIFLNLPASDGAAAAGALRSRLAAPDDTLLVPIRIAWTLPVNAGNPDAAEDRDGAGENHAPVPLRQLAFGDPRRPGSLRARLILRKDPGRAHCMAAAPATLGELKARFATQQKGSADLQPEDFAAFVARQAALALEIAAWGLIGRRYKVPRFIAGRAQSEVPRRPAGLAFAGSRPSGPARSGRLHEGVIAAPNALFTTCAPA
jgi:glycerol-3-phosphate O-acyltransferase